MSIDNNNSIPCKHRKFGFVRFDFTTYLASDTCHTKGTLEGTKKLMTCTHSKAMSSANSTERMEHLQWLPSN